MADLEKLVPPEEKTKKIYVFDMAWQGALICIAESEEEAVQKMIDADQLTQDCFDSNKHRYPLMAYDLDVVVSTKGDA